MRADAVRNRDRLLAAAEAVMAERGPDVSVADIATRAGVAKGTMFRHFATKEDLVAAIVVKHMIVLADHARRLLDAPDPETALVDFLTFAADQRQQRDLAYLISNGGSTEEATRVRGEAHDAVVALVDRAREHGLIRSDITGTDVFLLACAPVQVAENLPGAPSDLWRRYLAVIIDGLLRADAAPLPVPAPVWR